MNIHRKNNNNEIACEMSWIDGHGSKIEFERIPLPIHREIERERYEQNKEPQSAKK